MRSGVGKGEVKKIIHKISNELETPFHSEVEKALADLFYPEIKSATWLMESNGAYGAATAIVFRRLLDGKPNYKKMTANAELLKEEIAAPKN